MNSVTGTPVHAQPLTEGLASDDELSNDFVRACRELELSFKHSGYALPNERQPQQGGASSQFVLNYGILGISATSDVKKSEDKFLMFQNSECKTRFLVRAHAHISDNPGNDRQIIRTSVEDIYIYPNGLVSSVVAVIKPREGCTFARRPVFGSLESWFQTQVPSNLIRELKIEISDDGRGVALASGTATERGSFLGIISAGNSAYDMQTQERIRVSARDMEAIGLSSERLERGPGSSLLSRVSGPALVELSTPENNGRLLCIAKHVFANDEKGAK